MSETFTRVRRALQLLLLAGIATAAPFPILAQHLRLPERVEVDSDSIRLGDIALLDEAASSLASVDLGYAPQPGHYRWLDRGDVERALARNGWDPQTTALSMPDRTLITRQSRVVGKESVREAVTRFVDRQWPDLDLSIDQVQEPALLVLPRGELELQVTRAGHSSWLGWVSLKITPVVDGTARRAHWVRVRLSALQRLAVAARRLETGHRIEAGDLELVERRTEAPGRFLTSASTALGKVLLRGINAGEPLRLSDLRTPVMIRRGDLLSLQVSGRNFFLSANGRARRAGAIGETIPVENLETKKTVFARITGEKTAQVEVP